MASNLLNEKNQEEFSDNHNNSNLETKFLINELENQQKTKSFNKINIGRDISLSDNSNIKIENGNSEPFEEPNFNNKIIKKGSDVRSNLKKIVKSVEKKNSLHITPTSENNNVDYNDKKSIRNVIENINLFIDKNNKINKKNYSNVSKDNKLSKKMESKRIKDLINDDNMYGNYIQTETNTVEINELKKKILQNDNLQSIIGKDNNSK